MTITEYVDIVSKRFQSGISREHSYRGDLETLIRSLVLGIDVTNEPANVTDCGNPDYVITKGKIPIGYIEAKDIGKDLNGKNFKEQFGRYKKALDNLIITDYVWFQFFQNGVLVHEIKIADTENNAVKPLPENFSKFENLIKDFCTHVGQTIKSSKKLAEMMAGKARLLQDILERAITSDEETQENTSLKGQFDTFKQILIHDLEPKGFADIYAQTLAYGMFAARLHDPTLNDFSRQEAAELIPKSNPFLRKLFGYIAGPDIDERIVTVVDNLAEVFRATNVEQLLQNFGKSTGTQDPIIHFYETFLAEYDPKLRKARGVWYTPEPVVNFIVRAVDDILKTEFNLPQGLADTSKTKIKINTDVADKRSATGYKQIEKEVHKVQILDPATGTGTFLAEVVKFIHNKNFKTMQGAWSGYVEEHLIPRLNGFELLMASYAMAHLKLDMLLTETGYKPSLRGTKQSAQRLNIYLTNSLEEHHKDTGTLFSNWLSSEANEANHIKRDTPVMCVIGNPPYSGVSANNGIWITNLISKYKTEPDGSKLKEQNSKYLNDDYVKFIRYSEVLINKNGEGVLAFISNNGYIDNPTFRGMRAAIAKSFTDIYIIDLHGSTKKKEVALDGSPDQNVFDIMQGVAIIVAIKKKEDKNDATIHHYDCYGKRDFKYNFLIKNNLGSINFDEFKPSLPFYNFYSVDNQLQDRYYKLISLNKLFINNSVGIKTSRDNLLIAKSNSVLKENLKYFFENQPKDIEQKFSIKFNSKWNHQKLIDSLKYEVVLKDIKGITYRPFDNKFVCYNSDLVDRDRNKVMRNLQFKNHSLIVGRQGQAVAGDSWNLIFMSKTISDMNVFARGGGMAFPLYIYPNSEDGIFSEEKRKPNLNQDIVDQIAKKMGLTFVAEKDEIPKTVPDNKCFFPIDILDYIYAVLHSPTYREKYKEFLKIDFPRVPYPKNEHIFKQLVYLGSQLRLTHLLEPMYVEDDFIRYPNHGDDIVSKKFGSKSWELFDEKNQIGRVWINDDQYFNNVSKTAWEFYIGGYQPAQKWLKDRKERELKFEDIMHYQKIIVALRETDNLMKAIDKIDIE